jgi:hypothetical protein
VLQPDNICGPQVTVGISNPDYQYNFQQSPPLEQCLEVSIFNNILYLFIYCQMLIFDGFYDSKSSKLYGAGKVL